MLVFLSERSWGEVLPYAKHWYGSLKTKGRPNIEVFYTMDKRTADQLNIDERRNDWREGEESNKFIDRETLRFHGLKVFVEEFGEGNHLLVGDYYDTLNPSECIYGPYKDEINEIYEAWDSCYNKWGNIESGKHEQYEYTYRLWDAVIQRIT